MKWFWLILVLGLILSFIFKKDLYNFNNNNMDSDKNNVSEVLEYKTFDCQGFDFIFEFLDFKDWEFKYIEKKKESLCIMYFNSPDNIRYEIPPKIEIHKIEKMQSKDTSVLTKNPQNISYEYIQDPTLYVDGHKFEEGDWDWLVFYGRSFDVKIERAMFGEPPFDADLFYKKIIETFDFK